MTNGGWPKEMIIRLISTKIRDLIKTLWELKAGQEMQVGPSQLGRLKVIAPGQGTETGIEIELKGEKEKRDRLTDHRQVR